MDVQAGQHGLLYSVNTGSEEIEGVGTPLVTRPFYRIFAGTDIHGGRIALWQERVRRRGKEIGMLGNDFIRDVILLMHLDIQTVVLHAESAFGNRLISGIVGIELVDMNSTSDTYKRTDERIHIL